MRFQIYAVTLMLVPLVGDTLAQQPSPADGCSVQENDRPVASCDTTDPFGSVGENVRGDRGPFADVYVGKPTPPIQLTLFPRIENDEKAGTLTASLVIVNDTGADVLVHADTCLDWELHREIGPDLATQELGSTGALAIQPRRFLLLQPRSIEHKKRDAYCAVESMVVRHTIGPQADFPITMRGSFDFCLSGKVAVWNSKTSRFEMRPFTAEASLTLGEKGTAAKRNSNSQ